MYRNLKYFFIAILFASSSLTTNVYSEGLHFSNKILSCVGEKQISVYDVKQEMDRQIFMHQKDLFANPQTLGAYYTQNWKPTLKKMIEDELLLLEAEGMQYEVPTTDVTKKLSELYGDDLSTTLEFLSITESEARKHARREVLSAHMSWFNIWSKSVMDVTPKVVYTGYEKHLKELQKNDKWTYQAIYVKGSDKDMVAETTANVQRLTKSGKFENLTALLDQFPAAKEQATVKVSKEITLKSKELNPKLLNVLASLDEGMVSEPIITKSSGNNHTTKLLQLKKITKEPLPDFKKVNQNMKNTMVAKDGEKRAKKYFNSLYRKYDVNGMYASSDELMRSNELLFSFE